MRASSRGLLVACCVLLSVGVGYGLVCGNKECPAGDVCCSDGVMGSTCYNERTHDCVEERRLCGEGLGACGTVCYDRAMYACFDNRTLCPHTMQACGTVDTPQCYDPTLYSCKKHAGQEILISNALSECGGVGYSPLMNACDDGDISPIPIQTNCSVGQMNCRGQCYDPLMYDCVSGSLKALPGVCGVGLLWCSTQCFDPTLYNCVSGALQPQDNHTYTCPPSQLKCGGGNGVCYDSSLVQCLDGGVLCSVGMNVCGVACYDSNRYVCMNGTTLVGRPGYCAPQFSLCGSRCYDASAYTCVRGMLVPITSGQSCGEKTCPSGDNCCADMQLGSVCYSPNTHECVGSRRLCGSGLKACGSICFDHNLYVCIADEVITEKNRLCPTNFEVCGASQCYESSKFSCVGGGSILCPIGAPVCGDICYNKLKYTCVGGALLPSNNTEDSSSSDDSSSDDSSSSSSSSSDSSSSSSEDDSSSSSSSEEVCQTGQRRCGVDEADDTGACYSPDTHGCVNGEVVIICDIEEELCGADDCFDPNTHYCSNSSVIIPRIECDDDEEICGVKGGAVVCYDSDIWKCVNGSLAPLVLCGLNQSLCGSICYNEEEADCVNWIVVLKNYTCAADSIKCGSSNRCFDPKLYMCKAGVLACLHVCGDKQCFDIDYYACADNRTIVEYVSCSVNQLRCGVPRLGVCYSPDSYRCLNNTLACLESMELCGDGVCFDRSMSECVSGKVVAIGINNSASVVSYGSNVVVLLLVMLAALYM